MSQIKFPQLALAAIASSFLVSCGAVSKGPENQEENTEKTSTRTRRTKKSRNTSTMPWQRFPMVSPSNLLVILFSPPATSLTIEDSRSTYPSATFTGSVACPPRTTNPPPKRCVNIGPSMDTKSSKITAPRKFHCGLSTTRMRSECPYVSASRGRFRWGHPHPASVPTMGHEAHSQVPARHRRPRHRALTVGGGNPAPEETSLNEVLEQDEAAGRDK